jgi:4-amino-4-deoxy-L-arabinose transferase-like glycosyltransferase
MGLVARLASNDLINGFTAIFLLSLMLGGVPYLLFVAGILFWSRRQPVEAIRRLSYFAPVIFMLATAVLSLVAVFFGVSLREIGLFIAAFAIYTLLFGYLYVFIANFLYEILFDKPSDT